MLIGIDASRTTVAARTGTESYSLNIIRGLLGVAPGHRFRLYFRDEPPNGLFPEDERIETYIIQRPRLWTHTGLGLSVRQDPPDVLFVPSHVLPWPHIGDIPGVVTIHDLGYEHFPQSHPRLQRLYLRWSTRHSARIARRVIAVSQATADDLIALTPVSPTKVTAIHSGIDAQPQEDKTLRKRLGIPGDYILHVGSLRPRKNLHALVTAFEHIAEKHPSVSLVLAGSQSWGYDALLAHIHAEGVQERVILPGYVDDDDIAALYSGALVYVFPSLYEGFGFPLLEAMACGTPVACSNTSSLPEIAGDAARLFDPADTHAIAHAMATLIEDQPLREYMIQKGFERVKAFTWEGCARQTLTVLEAAVSSS